MLLYSKMRLRLITVLSSASAFLVEAPYRYCRSFIRVIRRWLRTESDLLFPISNSLLRKPNDAYWRVQPNHMNFSSPGDDECPSKDIAGALIHNPCAKRLR